MPQPRVAHTGGIQVAASLEACDDEVVEQFCFNLLQGYCVEEGDETSGTGISAPDGSTLEECAKALLPHIFFDPDRLCCGLNTSA